MRMALQIVRRLLRREALTGLLAVVLAVVVCVGLGFWQWHRFETKSSDADLITTNYNASPVALDDVLSTQDQTLSSDDRWKQVELTGTYCTDPGCVLYVRNRPLSSSVGFWQLVPFQTDQGTLLVVRGWIDVSESGSTPSSEPPIPEGTTTLVVHMRAAEPLLENRKNPTGQVQTVTPSTIAPDLPDLSSPLHTGAFGELVSEDPPISPMPHRLEEPDTSLGPHLSYAVQWWLFACFFPIAGIVRTRRQILDEAEAEGASGAIAAHSGAAGGGPADRSSGGPDGSGTGNDASDGRGPEGTGPRDRADGTSRTRGVSAEARRARKRTQDEEEEDELVDHGRR